MKDVNVVTLVCRLTRDPELRTTPSGVSVCSLRVAWSTSRKDPSTGDYVDRSNYCDVSVWGAQGEACGRYLSKGRQVCVQGRLEWREWQAQDGSKRSALDIQADQVQFIGSGDSGEDRSLQARAEEYQESELDPDPVELPAAGTGTDEPIPFLWEGPAFEFDLFHAHENRYALM